MGVSIRVKRFEEIVGCRQIVFRSSVRAFRPPLLFSSLFAALFMNFFLDFEDEVTKREPRLNLQGSSRTPLDPLCLHLKCQNMASREANDGLQNQDLR